MSNNERKGGKKHQNLDSLDYRDDRINLEIQKSQKSKCRQMRKEKNNHRKDDKYAKN